MARNQDPAAISDRWARGMSGAAETMRQGVNAVTTAPTEKAAAAADRYAEGVQRAVSSGKFQAGLRRVGLSDWQRAMAEKGIPRVASGAVSAKPKMESFMSQFIPHVEAGQRKLENMPRGDLSQNIARMVANVEHMAQFKRR